MVRERERQRGDLKHLSVHQWIRFAIPDSQQPTSPIGFLFLKLPPPPCAVLLVFYVGVKLRSWEGVSAVWKPHTATANLTASKQTTIYLSNYVRIFYF